MIQKGRVSAGEGGHGVCVMIAGDDGRDNRDHNREHNPAPAPARSHIAAVVGRRKSLSRLIQASFCSVCIVK